VVALNLYKVMHMQCCMYMCIIRYIIWPSMKEFYENTAALLKPLSRINSVHCNFAAIKRELLSAWEH